MNFLLILGFSIGVGLSFGFPAALYTFFATLLLVHLVVAMYNNRNR